MFDRNWERYDVILWCAQSLVFPHEWRTVYSNLRNRCVVMLIVVETVFTIRHRQSSCWVLPSWTEAIERHGSFPAGATAAEWKNSAQFITEDPDCAAWCLRVFLESESVQLWPVNGRNLFYPGPKDKINSLSRWFLQTQTTYPWFWTMLVRTEMIRLRQQNVPLSLLDPWKFISQYMFSLF